MVTEFAVTSTAYRLYHADLRANRIYTWLCTFFLGVRSQALSCITVLLFVPERQVKDMEF